MYQQQGPRCGRSVRGRYARCGSSRLRTLRGVYAPACARCLTRTERAELGMGPAPARVPSREIVDVAKLRAGDRD